LQGQPATLLQINCLELLSDKLAAEEFVDSPGSAAFRMSLLDQNLLEILLVGLRQYPPPPPNAKTMPKATSDGAALAMVLQFKIRLMKVLANLVYHHRESQDAVREAGGLADILNHCIMHPAYPLMREWGVLATRNVTEGNLENQEWIKKLKPQKVLPSKDLEKQGLKVVYDELTGKFKTIKSDAATTTSSVAPADATTAVAPNASSTNTPPDFVVDDHSVSLETTNTSAVSTTAVAPDSTTATPE